MKKILIAEDNKPAREAFVATIKYIFENAGRDVKIIEATNGLEAIKIFDENLDVDRVITDFEMPFLNGIEVIQRIRKRNTGVKILFQSGIMDKDLHMQATRAGATICLLKEEIRLQRLREFLLD